MKKDISQILKPMIALVLLASIAFSATMLYGYNKLAKELFLQQHGIRLTGAVQAMLEESYSLFLESSLQNKAGRLDDSEAMLEASIGIVKGSDLLADKQLSLAIDKMESMLTQMENSATPAEIAASKKEIAALLGEFENKRWGTLTHRHAELIERLDHINISLVLMNLILGLLVGALWYSDRQKERAKKELMNLNKSLEKTIAQKTAKLKSTSESKSVFLSNISHDIKTPLNSIIGYTTLLLEDDSLEDKKRKKLESILGSANYISELSCDMMDISRIESGKIKLYLEKFNIVELETNIYALFSNAAVQKGVTLCVDAKIEENAAAYADKQKLLRILSNLVSNAIKFTSSGGAVAVKIKESEENIYSFEVQDSGRGIPRESAEKIFEPFFQIDANGEVGNGLGLFIVKSYLEAMGSTIGMSSSDKGSIFYFDLDLAPALNAPIKKRPKQPPVEINSYKNEPSLDEELKKAILESARLGHTSTLKQNIAKIKSELLKKRLFYFADLFEMGRIAGELETFEKEKAQEI